MERTSYIRKIVHSLSFFSLIIKLDNVSNSNIDFQHRETTRSQADAQLWWRPLRCTDSRTSIRTRKFSIPIISYPRRPPIGITTLLYRSLPGRVLAWVANTLCSSSRSSCPQSWGISASSQTSKNLTSDSRPISSSSEPRALRSEWNRGN